MTAEPLRQALVLPEPASWAPLRPPAPLLCRVQDSPGGRWGAVQEPPGSAVPVSSAGPRTLNVLGPVRQARLGEATVGRQEGGAPAAVGQGRGPLGPCDGVNGQLHGHRPGAACLSRDPQASHHTLWPLGANSGSPPPTPCPTRGSAQGATGKCFRTESQMTQRIPT